MLLRRVSSAPIRAKFQSHYYTNVDYPICNAWVNQYNAADRRWKIPGGPIPDGCTSIPSEVQPGHLLSFKPEAYTQSYTLTYDTEFESATEIGENGYEYNDVVRIEVEVRTPTSAVTKNRSLDLCPDPLTTEFEAWQASCASWNALWGWRYVRPYVLYLC